jgi:hypothetical protein
MASKTTFFSLLLILYFFINCYKAKHSLNFSFGAHHTLVIGDNTDYLRPPVPYQVNMYSPYYGYYRKTAGAFHAGFYHTRFFPDNYFKIHAGVAYFNRRCIYHQTDTVITKLYHASSIYLNTEYDVSSNNIELPFIFSYYQGNYSISCGLRYSLISAKTKRITDISGESYKSKGDWEFDFDKFIPTIQASYKLTIGSYQPSVYLAVDRETKKIYNIQVGVSSQLKKY